MWDDSLSDKKLNSITKCMTYSRWDDNVFSVESFQGLITSSKRKYQTKLKNGPFPWKNVSNVELLHRKYSINFLCHRIVISLSCSGPRCHNLSWGPTRVINFTSIVTVINIFLQGSRLNRSPKNSRKKCTW